MQPSQQGRKASPEEMDVLEVDPLNAEFKFKLHEFGESSHPTLIEPFFSPSPHLFFLFTTKSKHCVCYITPVGCFKTFSCFLGLPGVSQQQTLKYF